MPAPVARRARARARRRARRRPRLEEEAPERREIAARDVIDRGAQHGGVVDAAPHRRRADLHGQRVERIAGDDEVAGIEEPARREGTPEQREGLARGPAPADAQRGRDGHEGRHEHGAHDLRAGAEAGREPERGRVAHAGAFRRAEATSPREPHHEGQRREEDRGGAQVRHGARRLLPDLRHEQEGERRRERRRAGTARLAHRRRDGRAGEGRERRLAGLRERVRARGREEEREEELDVRGRVGGRRIAEHRRDDRDAAVSKPRRGRVQVIRERVVEERRPVQGVPAAERERGEQRGQQAEVERRPRSRRRPCLDGRAARRARGGRTRRRARAPPRRRAGDRTRRGAPRRRRSSRRPRGRRA